MAAFFSNLRNTIVAGVVLIVVLIILVGIGVKFPTFGHDWATFLVRALHILSGIMWIGLLYYFNFVQTPGMPKIPDEQKPAISKVIAPSALFFFRWAAAGTVLFGLLTAGANGYLGAALSFQVPTIGIGMWLALIMAANVWFIIWPNQKKVLGIVQADADAKKAAGRVAMLASRANTMLSIPMLYCMVAQQNIG
jgi:uncharacterized membrane protein